MNIEKLILNKDKLSSDELEKLNKIICWVSGHYPDAKRVYQPKPVDHDSFKIRNGFNGEKFIKKTKNKLEK